MVRVVFWPVAGLVALYGGALALVWAGDAHAASARFRVAATAAPQAHLAAVEAGAARLDANLAAIFDEPPAETRATVLFTASPREFTLLSPLTAWHAENQPFAVAYGAAGVVVFGRIDLDAGLAYRGDGKTRPLAGVIAHELAHVLLAERLGLRAERAAPTWALEGLADTLSGDSTEPMPVALARLCREDPLAERPSYATYRLAVIYLARAEAAGIEAILASRESLAEVLDRARAPLCSGALPLHE